MRHKTVKLSTLAGTYHLPLREPIATRKIGDMVTLPKGQRVGAGKLRRPVNAMVTAIESCADGKPIYRVSWVDLRGRDRHTWID